MDGEYVSVSRSNVDDNNYYYYRYRSGGRYVNVYPELESSITPDRSENYPVYQFYSREAGYSGDSKIVQLQEAVKNFIDAAMRSNSNIENDADKHKISIVKFATNAYYNGTSSTQDENSTAVGNNFNGDGYNYTQIVQPLTTVNASGAATLKSKIDALYPAGATAVDYGIALADHVLFDDRTAAEIAGRHEIVVVFTDGSPTHSSDYEDYVAADAINNAYALKSQGVEVYTISVAAKADDSQLGSDKTNIFCHYVSSNYPYAQASGQNVITAGEGSPTAGYYWVPDDIITLDAIFETVMNAVGTPTIELGTSAAVIDSLTPYFTLPDGAGDIALYTRAKTANDWGPLENDSNLSATVTGSSVRVTGFDFDANYISQTPRDGNFYGKMLHIVINVTPDYTVVDNRTEAIAAAGGYVETNLGNAAVLDSAQNPVAVVKSPGVTMNTVTYMLDGVPYKTYYRFPGSSNTVLPPHADDDVRTYSDWTTADVTVNGGAFTMPSGNVVFNATSTMVDYTVSYEYRGDIPTGVSPAPATETYNAGDSVNVATAPSVTGYVFSGWQSVEVIPVNGEFDMPARNVKFIGSFAPSDTVAYKIEHYLQNTDGEFPQEPSDFHYHYDGTTGKEASAIIMDYPQFTYAETVTTPSNVTYNSVPKGIVKADGSLVLKLYYIRNVHTVTYKYDVTPPTGAPEAPAAQSHRTGETVTVKAIPTLQGYTFIGWASDRADVIITDGKFLMPDHDVTLHGFFLENGDTPYKVEHYLESDTDGVYEATPEETTDHTGKTNALVVGEPLNFEGYTYNATYSAPTAEGQILADGSLVLQLYYDKTPYTVSYQFTGITPNGGFPTLPAATTQHMGDTVSVEGIPTVSGYTFHGWFVNNVTVSGGQFTMPDEDVVFTGYFVRNEAPYTISHYFQLEDGTWGDPQYSYKVDSHEGELVSADYVTVDGYENYPGHTDTKTEGKVAADGSLELKLFYKRTAYKVTYKYEGTAPDGAAALPAETTQLHGVTVTVAPNATAPGYTFSGWSSESVTIDGGKFTMPHADVVIVGSFTANTDTPWSVEHYKQNLDGTYNAAPDDVENFTGTTGYRVSASYKQYEGFTPAENNVLTGTITPAPNTLVIKLYYERNTYDVFYHYIGVQPDGAPDISKYDIDNVPYGTVINLAAKPTLANHTFEGWTSHEVEVSSGSFTMPAMDVIILGKFVENAKLTVSYEYSGTAPAGVPDLPNTTYHHPKENIAVADEPVLPGYIFSGWSSEQVSPVAGKFDMPDVDVVFKGSFTPDTGTIYKVEHYKQNLDGTYPAVPSDTDTLSDTTGETVVAAPKAYDGFTEDTAHTDRVAEGVVKADGSLVLKLYYSRNSYKVSYSYTGTVPTGATPLPETKTYKYGEEVTVAPAAKATGYQFIGWLSSDVTPTDGKFTMPAKDVEFTGSFNIVITSGTVVVTKKVVAPVGFNSTLPFKFQIRRVDSTTYETFYVTPGSSVVLNLAPGRYHIAEIVGNISGFTHSVHCSDKDGIIDVTLGSRTDITFTNVYVEVEVQLEKDDHFGYIIGYPDDTVRPENNITRAEVATIFFRMLKDESRVKLWSTTNSFSDVSRGMWFNTAISTLENAGVLDGYEDGTFRPNEYITRAELVKIAVSFYGTTAGKETHFSDTSSHWANDFIEAARELGFVDGYGDGTFRPNRYVTRAETMKIINRTLDRAPHKDYLHRDMIVWIDNADKSKWYYAEVQEATNSHIYVWLSKYERWTEILPVRDWAELEKSWHEEHP